MLIPRLAIVSALVLSLPGCLPLLAYDLLEQQQADRAPTVIVTNPGEVAPSITPPPYAAAPAYPPPTTPWASEPLYPPPTFYPPPPPNALAPSASAPPRYAPAAPVRAAQVASVPVNPFDPAGARAAVEQVAIGDCPLRGIELGVARATVIFDPKGFAKRIAIAAPPDLSLEAINCMNDKIGRVRIAPFDGGERAVDAHWQVP